MSNKNDSKKMSQFMRDYIMEVNKFDPVASMELIRLNLGIKTDEKDDHEHSNPQNNKS